MEEKDIEIRKMEEKDVDFILDLGNSTEELWMDDEVMFPFGEEELVNWSKSENKLGYIFEFNEERIGFALLEIDSKMAEIVAFTIEEKYRNKGHGKYILKKILDELEEEGVTAQMVYTGADNEKAIEFYSELGFKKGEEVLTMYRGLE